MLKNPGFPVNNPCLVRIGVTQIFILRGPEILRVGRRYLWSSYFETGIFQQGDEISVFQISETRIISAWVQIILACSGIILDVYRKILDLYRKILDLYRKILEGVEKSLTLLKNP